MQLQNLVKTGRIHRAQRITLYGPESVGKTTLAAQFPDPLILDAEDGSTHLDAARIQTPTEETFFQALRTLASESPGYRTLVIDTVTNVELFHRERVLKRHKMRNIEDFGYGRGYTYVREEFNSFLTGYLDRFIRSGINVVVVCHSVVKRTQPPGLSDAFDRYELALDTVNAARLKQWSDAVLFLFWDTRIVENAEGRVRGVGGKERVIFTTHSAAFDAKNRVGLSEKLECSFAALAPLLGDADAPESQPESGKGQAHGEPVQATSPPRTGITVELSAGDNGETPQQRMAAALSDEDPELVRLFLLNRKVCDDGLVQSVPDDYAIRALEHLPRFRERLAQFSNEPF
jgi:AAA domain